MMLGFKASQSVKPSYDHYGDTDTDNATDQLVDFSKRYPDDPEEIHCASSMKNSQLPLESLNSEENKQTYDELKVYYTEGTPSSASYWDLTQVGINEQIPEALILEEQTRIDHCFSSTHNFSVATPDTGTKNCIESNFDVDEIHPFDQTEKRESNEEECTNQETEASFTKSSSPLMFSRTSSVGSLNSFEQHSIVDDRSSVSAFSNLASGMISPSEIPDSPFEVASPFISKSKNNEFLFPSNDKSEDPILVDQTIPNADFPDEAYGDDVLKVFDDEGDCPSVSNLSALSIQANSIHEPISFIQSNNTLVSFTQRLSVTVNCFTDEESTFREKCQTVEILDETDVLEQSSINAMPSHTSDINKGEKTQSVIEIKYENKGTSTSEDFEFCSSNYEQDLSPIKDKLLKSIQTSTPLNNKVKEVRKFPDAEVYKAETYVQQYQDERLSSDDLKGNSDDESDDILEDYAVKGKPRKEDSVFNDSKQSLNYSFQTSESTLKESFDVPNCSFSDNDVSADDVDDDDVDEMMNEYILLGKPHTSSNTQIKAEKSSACEISSSINVADKELSVSNTPSHQLELYEEMVSQEKQVSDEENLNLIVPESPSNHSNFAKEEEFSTFNLISQSNDQMDDSKTDLAKSDDDTDNEETDLLMEHVTKLGGPKIHIRSPKSPEETKLPVTYPPNKNLGSRDDNCPDGVSDGEDDDDVDDMMDAVINAGKPGSKSETNKSPYGASAPGLKPQNQRKLTAAEDRQLYLDKYYYENIPKACAPENSVIGVDDSMCVYRTEDTPLLSPTASLSDLSTLSFTEDKVCQESFLNNSRNSDCSSDSEEDELMIQCVQRGMPGVRKVAA